MIAEYHQQHNNELKCAHWLEIPDDWTNNLFEQQQSHQQQQLTVKMITISFSAPQQHVHRPSPLTRSSGEHQNYSKFISAQSKALYINMPQYRSGSVFNIPKHFCPICPHMRELGGIITLQQKARAASTFSEIFYAHFSQYYTKSNFRNNLLKQFSPKLLIVVMLTLFFCTTPILKKCILL